MDSKKAPPNSDRKRKQWEMGGKYEDPSSVDPQLNLLSQMVQMLESSRERDERGETTGNRNQEIYKAKTQVEDIHAMKRALDEYSNNVYKQLLEKQDARIRGLFDSTSPLLSLNKPVLRHLIGYLDEEALLSLEEASTTVKQYFVNDALVELDNRRKQHGSPGFFPIPLKQSAKDRDPTPMERARSYKMAASSARNMEAIASQHYNYDQQAIENNGKSSSRPHFLPADGVLYEDMEVHCSGCKVFDFIPPPFCVLEDYGDGGDSVFVRLSHRTTIGQRSPLIWQGFVKHKEVSEFLSPNDDDEYYSDEEKHIIEYQQMTIPIDNAVDFMDWPEMTEYRRMLVVGASDQEKESQLERLAANLQVTVVLVPTTPGCHRQGPPSGLQSPGVPRGEGAYLVVATGGFHECPYDRKVSLKPRNKRPHDKAWNPKNFLQTFIDIRTGGFDLTILNDNPFQRWR